MSVSRRVRVPRDENHDRTNRRIEVAYRDPAQLGRNVILQRSLISDSGSRLELSLLYPESGIFREASIGYQSQVSGRDIAVADALSALRAAAVAAADLGSKCL